MSFTDGGESITSLQYCILFTISEDYFFYLIHLSDVPKTNTYVLIYFTYLLLIYLLTYLLTPWSRVLPEKLTDSQLVKKFPTFYGTRRFITAVTSAHHLSLCWAAWSSPHPHIPLPEDPS
jgi:hypothetical protein